MTKDQALEVLELSPETHSYRQGYNRYRYLLKKYHPDKGGSTEQCQAIIAAWEIAKPLLPKSQLPVAYLLKDDDSDSQYLRWVGLWYINDLSEDYGYRYWAWYEKEGDVYVSVLPNIDNLPESEHRIVDKETHTVKIVDKTLCGAIPMLRVKEIEPKKFVVERYQ